MDFAGLIREYGYVAVFLGTLLEGETVVLLAGFAAQRGHLALPVVAACAFAGSLLSDQVNFHLGRRHGSAWLLRHPRWQQRLARVRALADEHQVKLTLAFRFTYGTRTLVPFALGLSNMSRLRFAALNAVSAAVWSLTIAVLGFTLGHTLEPLLGDLERYEAVLFACLAAAGIAWSLLRRRKARGAAPAA